MKKTFQKYFSGKPSDTYSSAQTIGVRQMRNAKRRDESLRSNLKEATELALGIVTLGCTFHNLGAATEKARSQKQARLDLGTRRVMLVLERNPFTIVTGFRSEEM